jgi:hypothetical protein
MRGSRSARHGRPSMGSRVKDARSGDYRERSERIANRLAAREADRVAVRADRVQGE